MGGEFGMAGKCLWVALIGGPPAAAAGAMLGHPLIGFLCGLASSAVMVGWMLYAAYFA
jgi:hypothetical protein